MMSLTPEALKQCLTPHQRLVFYDASCGVCTRSKRLMNALDVWQCLKWVPMETPGLESVFEGLPPVEQRRGAITVWQAKHSGGGQVSRGPLAIAAMLEVCPWPGAWLAWGLRLPVLQPLTHKLYAWVAANRHKWLPPPVNDSCQL